MRDDAGALTNKFEFIFNIFGYCRQLLNYIQQVGAAAVIYGSQWCALRLCL